MGKQQCEGCRWFRRTDNEHDVFGQCRRFPPLHSQNTAWLAVRPEEWCGEWQDATITPEQAERRELVKQFALAIVQGMSANPEELDVNLILLAPRFADQFIKAMQEGQQ